MSRADSVRIAGAAAAALLALACAGAAGGGGRSGWVEDTVVRFTYDAVDPPTVRIASGAKLGWLNLSPDTYGFIVFPASIAGSFRCADLRPYFVKVAAGYTSRPISDTDIEKAKLPCALAPGSYPYEIWLRGAGFGEEFDAGKPDQVLRATLVVE